MARRTSRRQSEDRARRQRRGGVERRGGRDRRREAHDLYRTDLDRHLWTFPGSASRRRKRAKRKRAVKRRIARVVAGTIGVAGLAYYLYRRSQGGEDMRPEHTDTARTAAADEEEEGAGV